MSNDVNGTSSFSKKRRTHAYDTGVLPPEILTEEEKEVLRGINDLLEQMQRQPSSSTTEYRCPNRSPWANPDGALRNNVIMIDGGRGLEKRRSCLPCSQVGHARKFSNLSDEKKNLKG